jgi:uncharacterized protein (TIGR03382 family)
MRTLCLLSLVLPSVASAYDGEAEEVRFETRTQLFRGEDFTQFWPAEDSVVAVKFAADTSTEVAVDMTADSNISWPTAMKHEWNGVVSGGLAELHVVTTLEAAIRINSFGTTVDLPVWTQPFDWTAQTWFDSMLLPGATESVALSLADAHFFQTDVELEIADGWLLTFGLDGNPLADAVVTGASVTTNGVLVTDTDVVTQLPIGASNDGVYDVEALWAGHVDAAWGVELIPWIRVDVTDLGTLELPLYDFEWDLGTDSRDLVSKGLTFEHNIPAIDVDASVDLGTVEVGQVAERYVTIDNDGELRLTGRGTYTGDAAFRALETSFTADPGDDDRILVRFTPTEAGDFEGTLTVASNDPVNPSIVVDVFGTATAPVVEEDDTDGFGRIRGCGCDQSAPAGGTAGFAVALLGLAGLRRRR